MSGDTKRVLEVNQIDNLQGSTQRVKQETTLNNLRGITQRVYVVGGGGEPINNQDKTITENGSYTADEGYTGLGTVTVNVPTTAPAHYVEKTVDANGKLVNSTNVINLNGVTDVGDGALAYAYNKASFPANTSIDLSGLTTISGSNACQSMFFNCTGLTSVDLSSLTTISGSCNSMFSGCTSITSIDLSSLTTITSNSACQTMFQKCTSLSTVYIGGITAIDFGTRTNQFSNIFQGCTQNIDVYAPAANQTQIEAMSGYPNFGGTGTVTWHWRS